MICTASDKLSSFPCRSLAGLQCRARLQVLAPRLCLEDYSLCSGSCLPAAGPLELGPGAQG